MIPMDPDNVVRNSVKWLQSLAIDSKDNVYIGWIMGGALSKYERATGKVSVFRLPTPHAIVYGVVADRNDNIWIAEWSGGKIAKFDTTHQPVDGIHAAELAGPRAAPERRLPEQHLVGNLCGGQSPGKLVKLDQTTGRMTEYTIPLRNSQPYDVAADTEGNIWFADSPMPDRAAAIGKFNTKDQTFTFYPKPQFAADTPKIQVTRDGSVWFSPRGTQVDAPAISVLHPDMDKITTLGAYYVNGAPGYPFKVTAAPIGGREIEAVGVELAVQGRADALRLRRVRQGQEDHVERREESARPEAPARGAEGRSDLLLPHRRRESGRRDRQGARRRLQRSR